MYLWWKNYRLMLTVSVLSRYLRDLCKINYGLNIENMNYRGNCPRHIRISSDVGCWKYKFNAENTDLMQKTFFSTNAVSQGGP